MRHKPAHHPHFDASRALKRAHRARQDGEFAKSERLYSELLQRGFSNFDVWHGLGEINFQRGRPDLALVFFQDALKCEPFRAEGFFSLGLAFHALRDFARALASHEEGLRLRPDDVELLNACGVALLELRRPLAALPLFERALSFVPDHPDALGNRANALLKLNQVEEAIAAYEQALARTPHSAPLLANYAAALRRFDRPHQALAIACKALAIDRDFAHARFVESVASLSLGDFAAGWAAYESRWQVGWLAAQHRDFTAPLWRGEEPLDGKTILLHAEQGLGDTIQFARYAPLLAARGARVILEVQPQLVRLLSDMRGVAAVFARKQPLPPYDFHCPLLSLPLVCGTTLETVPADVPYLAAEQGRAVYWRTRLPRQRPLIGVVWSGERSHDNDLNRSMRLATLAPILEVPNLAFVSLQHEVRDEDVATLAEHRDVMPIGAQFEDFADTAAAIAALDAVIAVDTAVAHLAGAMGRPLFLLLPFAADFRWLRGRADSPWYPSARLFRQPRFGDWAGAVEMLRTVLGHFQASRAA